MGAASLRKERQPAWRRMLAHSAVSASRRFPTEDAAAASEEQFRLLVEGTRDHAILMLDPDGVIRTWNSGAERIKGYTAAQAIGRHFSAFYTPADIAAGHPAEELVLARTHGIYAEEGWRVRRDGSQFWASVVITALYSDSGELRGFGKVTRDLTERQEAQQKLQASEELFRRAFEDAPLGVALLDNLGHVTRANPGLADLTGYSIETLQSMNFADLTYADDRASHVRDMADLAAGAIPLDSVEVRFQHALGHSVWVMMNLAPVCDDASTVVGLLLHAQDISDRRRHEEQLVRLSQRDPLTGLTNRSRFAEELTAHLDRCQQVGPTGALLLLDLDHFKRVNDTLGHNAGDELILSMADVLRQLGQPGDVLARLGGDEFAVLLVKGDREEVAQRAAHVVASVRENLQSLSGDKPRRVTVSVGAALINEFTSSSSDLLMQADLAMYDAKDAGRDRYAFYSTEGFGVPRTKARIDWAERIDTALTTDAFEFVAQPILDLHTNQINTFELLLRMRQPSGEVIAPGVFLYVAERMGMIREIDKWVATHSIALLERVQAYRPDVRFEVNLSGLSVGNSDVREHIARELSTHKVNPAGLVFEITETAAVAHIHQAREFADHLSDLGCQFALDDFGAGFGSFFYLKHLPFDYVKIDGEFIKNSTSNSTDRLIIASVVDIAKGMGKQTVAEFVHDQPTLRLLQTQGVDYAQGYHVGRPLSIARTFPELARMPGQERRDLTLGPAIRR